MAISVVMPALEMAQDTGKLVSWRKKEGERVAKGEILLEVETDKAVVEVEALADGVLGGVKAQPGRRDPGRPDHRVAARSRRIRSGGRRTLESCCGRRAPCGIFRFRCCSRQARDQLRRSGRPGAHLTQGAAPG